MSGVDPPGNHGNQNNIVLVDDMNGHERAPDTNSEVLTSTIVISDPSCTIPGKFQFDPWK